MFLVTPSLNQAALLAQCVANVARLGENVFHHVQDGASGDGTKPLLHQTLGQRGESAFGFESKTDGGLYPALNRAFTRSGAHEVLGWLNCDDLLLPWTAVVVESVFDRHPCVDVVYGDALELRAGRWALTVQPPPHLIRRFVAAGTLLAQPAVFFRRALFERLGGLDVSYRLLADADFFLRALRSGAHFMHVGELLAIQRMAPGQLMQRHASQAQLELAQLWQRHGLVSHPSRMPALWHRLGVLSLAWPGGLWPRTREAGLITRAGWARWLKVLLRSSSGVVYLEPGPGLAGLLPMVDLP